VDHEGVEDPARFGSISDPDEASDDDGKPRFHTKPSRRKTKWSSNLGQSQVKAGINMLQDQEQAQEFKSLELPDSIAYLGPKLKKGKAFEDAELLTNAAGTCGQAALTCAESSRADQFHMQGSYPALARRFPRGVGRAQGMEG
jgi:hypothetical protein